MSKIGYIKSIVCRKCDYKHTDENIVLSEWLNKPCPKCGENLITQKEYDFALAMLKIADFLSLPVISHIVVFINLIFNGGKKGRGTLVENDKGKVELKNVRIFK